MEKIEALRSVAIVRNCQPIENFIKKLDVRLSTSLSLLRQMLKRDAQCTDSSNARSSLLGDLMGWLAAQVPLEEAKVMFTLRGDDSALKEHAQLQNEAREKLDEQQRQQMLERQERRLIEEEGAIRRRIKEQQIQEKKRIEDQRRRAKAQEKDREARSLSLLSLAFLLL